MIKQTGREKIRAQVRKLSDEEIFRLGKKAASRNGLLGSAGATVRVELEELRAEYRRRKRKLSER